ncbi:MAG: hypothetical protein RL338_268 [Chloroflexota bacterium]
MASDVATGTGTDDGLRGEVRRTTLLLAASLTLSWTVIQLQSSLTAVTLAQLASPALAGIGSTVFLGAGAVAAVVSGRLMDRRGRRTGLRAGFLVGAAGAVVVHLGTANASLPLFLAGIATIGAAVGTIGLARVAAADLHPPATRARGISVVLMGSAFGALVGPIVFGPLLAGVHHELAAMAVPWLIAAVVFLAGALVIGAIRIEPLELGRRVGVIGASSSAGSPVAAAPVEERSRSARTILANRTVRVTVITLVAAQAVMAMAMAVVGLVLVGHGHDLAAVSLTYSAHFLGMYGLVLLVGPFVDRVGHRRSLVVGIAVELAGALLLLAGGDPPTMIPAIFLVGLGWNVAFVASTTLLADATDAGERGRAIGLADALATTAAAVGSLAATEVLAHAGLAPLVAGLVVIGLVPLPLIALERRAERARATA